MWVELTMPLMLWNIPVKFKFYDFWFHIHCYLTHFIGKIPPSLSFNNNVDKLSDERKTIKPKKKFYNLFVPATYYVVFSLK